MCGDYHAGGRTLCLTDLVAYSFALLSAAAERTEWRRREALALGGVVVVGVELDGDLVDGRLLQTDGPVGEADVCPI